MSQQLPVNDKLEADKSIKVAPFKKGIRKTSAHRHNNYFEIIYLSKGSGYHYIDLNKYPITPPVMFFVRQEQVHFWEMESEPDGYVVIIRKLFIEKSLDKELKTLLGKISSQSCLQVNDNSTIEKLLELLTVENKFSGDYSFHITEGLLKSLLSKILQVSKPVLNKAETKTDLYHAFFQLVNSETVVVNKVGYYAELLSTSPQNLNTACQKAVQKTASEVLADFIIMEAKRLLLYTDQTVSEIAFTLDFTDASHFVKYFKKIVRCTPQAFRTADI